MSKSAHNGITLGANPDEIRAKVDAMHTDANHLRVCDPGRVEGNAVFAYLEAFDPDRAGLDELKARYRRGGLADRDLKRRLETVLLDLLEPIRARRVALGQDTGRIWDLLKEGTAKASERTAETLLRVRRAMGINYFEDEGARAKALNEKA